MSAQVRTYTTGRGFTLLEMLIAVTVLAMISAIVFAAFAGVTETTDQARSEAEEMRMRQFLTRNIHNNLCAAFADPALVLEEFRFIGMSEDGLDGPADSIEFASTAPLIGGGSLPGAIKAVRYGVVDQNDTELGASTLSAGLAGQEEQGSMLESIEMQLVLPSETNEEAENQRDPNAMNAQQSSMSSGSRFGNSRELDVGEDLKSRAEDAATPESPTPSWSVPIRNMDITYFDGQEWVEDWDSLAMQRLPWSVCFKINFLKTEVQRAADDELGVNDEEDPDLELVIPLPSAVGIVTPAEAFAQYPEFAPPKWMMMDGMMGIDDGTGTGLMPGTTPGAVPGSAAGGAAGGARGVNVQNLINQAGGLGGLMR